MPLLETLPVGPGCAQWAVWGTTARVVVTDPGRLDDAVTLIQSELAAVDEACSRFRPDSELERVLRRRGRPTSISPRLAELIRTSLTAATETDGAVDPTPGSAM